MEQMQKRLPEIMLHKPDTDGNEDEDGEGDSEANPESNFEVDHNEEGEVES